MINNAKEEATTKAAAATAVEEENKVKIQDIKVEDDFDIDDI